VTDNKQEIAEKIRKLLDKAESTNFGPEAESLIAKAHELMARYEIEEIMLHEARGVREDVKVKQVKVTAAKKFAEQRHGLLHQIAMIHRSRAIITNDFMTLLGYETDLEFVEVMYASLVVQMFEALFQQREHTNQKWADNFCWGFVGRITERLKETQRKVEAEVAPTGSSTALVLVSRGELVDKKTEQMFPNLKSARVKKIAYDPVARAKGASAADNADIGQTGVGSRKDAIDGSRQGLNR
jgi:hypothetical protein